MKFKILKLRAYPKCPNCDIGYLQWIGTTPLEDDDGNYDTKDHIIHKCTHCTSVYELIEEDEN